MKNGAGGEDERRCGNAREREKKVYALKGWENRGICTLDLFPKSRGQAKHVVFLLEESYDTTELLRHCFLSDKRICSRSATSHFPTPITV